MPARLAVAERIRHRLRRRSGHAGYARRKAIVEPESGSIEQARDFRRSLPRGLERVRQEWPVGCTAPDLLKLRATWEPA
jgi:hypothetical protein